ncbi:MAG: hypothetical protein KatS3mg087_0493 [Patescibacteria group bacterium]|nr:MAG: hypothetical protein KatS3mg087_0493 [Patescibacteria group bacterium]
MYAIAELVQSAHLFNDVLNGKVYRLKDGRRVVVVEVGRFNDPAFLEYRVQTLREITGDNDTIIVFIGYTEVYCDDDEVCWEDDDVAYDPYDHKPFMAVFEHGNNAVYYFESGHQRNNALNQILWG